MPEYFFETTVYEYVLQLFSSAFSMIIKPYKTIEEDLCPIVV